MTFSWAETRERAAKQLGGYPDADLEQEIIEVFRERPAFVVGVLEDVGRGYEAGRVHSPWLLARKQLQASPAELVVDDESERERQVKRAEHWLRTCGLYFDRESEVAAELFEGMLRAWATDEALRERLLGLWRELRPRGERAEREALEHAAARVAVREKLAGERAA